MKLIRNILLLILLISCAQVTSLGLKKHEFGKLPVKIVWFQIAGLDEEHIALLKFDYPLASNQTSFEDFICTGKAWDYNLYQLRQSAYNGFLSQMTGKKNIQNNCEDYKLKPIWSYMTTKGYKLGLFEGQMSKDESIEKSLQCDERYLSDLVLWKMDKTQIGNLFHQSERKVFEEGKIYHDRSCSKNNDCFTTFSSNVISVHNNFYKNSSNYLYIVRNFRFQNLIKNKDIKAAKVELDQINQSIKYFLDKADDESNLLVLLTTAETYDAHYPSEGKQWEKFVNASKFDLGKHSRLLSPVFASGARAENFCGLFDQNEVLNRIFSGAKQQGLEYTIINPFN